MSLRDTLEHLLSGKSLSEAEASEAGPRRLGARA